MSLRVLKKALSKKVYKSRRLPRFIMNRDNIVTRWECYAQSKNGYSTIVHKPSTKDTKEIYRTVLVVAQIVTAKIISHFLDL